MRQVSGRLAAVAALAVVLASWGSAPAFAAPPVVLAQAFFDSFGDEPEDSAPDDSAPGLDIPKLNLPEEDEGPGAEPMLRPDAKEGAGDAAPPHSAEDTKGNRLEDQAGDEAGELPPLNPLDRPKMLARLYDDLGLAKDAHSAEPIMAAIEQLWTLSGSDTVDLLMSRAEQFANDSEINLSLAILDAVVDIAPQEPEAWYLRAKVNVLNGKPERALVDLRRALALDPKHYKAITDLGLVLEQLGAKKEALEAYRRALAVNPFLDDAREGVEALKREVEGQDI